MVAETHALVLTKPAFRNLNEGKVEKNIDSLLDAFNTKSALIRGWRLQRARLDGMSNRSWRQTYAPNNEEAEYLYEMHLDLTFERKDDKKPNVGELRNQAFKVYTKAGQPTFGTWSLHSVDGEKFVADKSAQKETDKLAELDYAEVVIPKDWDSYFSHLYGLDAHIGIIKRALQAGLDSGWRNRFHCVLQGPPGCGKSDIAQSLKNALGDEAVLEFDATSTTAAGAINELELRDILPRIMIIEEIEKAPENAMTFLLGVLDLRGEIRKTTMRKSIQRETKLFAVATVNNVALFNTLQAGALSSRFANKIFFRHPDRSLLELILAREIAKVKNGSLEWIKPALDYCAAAEITDPRIVSAICLTGGNALLTGEFQKMLMATSEDGVNNEEEE